MKYLRSPGFIFALAIILVSILLMFSTYFLWLPLNFVLGPYRFTHWLSWTGVLLIAIFTPIFYILRRRYPNRNAVMTNIHAFCNLFSFMLISVHFAQQMSRSVQPEDRTGLAMYIIVSILVATGFLHKFQILEKGMMYPPHRNRYLHISITTAFYIVVTIHVLHNIGMI